jgi:hypothetical protein
MPQQHKLVYCKSRTYVLFNKKRPDAENDEQQQYPKTDGLAKVLSFLSRHAWKFELGTYSYAFIKYYTDIIGLDPKFNMSNKTALQICNRS